MGVVGVWTEAKVSFLLYDLKTRLGIEDLATGSALTASASRAQHFNSLTQLAKILGVQCFESLADFVDWLRPGSELALPQHPRGIEPRIDIAAGSSSLGSTDRAIVADLFRDSTEVDLEPISGGYSGALVLSATSHDALGHRQAPSVVKLGPNRSIARERVAFEQLEEVLGNNAPSVRGASTSGTEPASSTHTPLWVKARSGPCNRCSCRTHRPAAFSLSFVARLKSARSPLCRGPVRADAAFRVLRVLPDPWTFGPGASTPW